MNNTWLKILHHIELSHYTDLDAASANIRQNVAFRGPNIVILFCAIIIASLGLNVNSTPVIIGAMLISPLMSPIVGFGLSLATNDTALLRYSLKNLAVMVGISLLASTLFFLISPLDMENPTELLARTNPTIYDVLIALFGGFAGMVELSRKEKGTVLSGVAIATALMPPLCTVGYGIATARWNYALGAGYLFFINCIFIALASYLASKYLGYHTVSEQNAKVQRRHRWIATLLLVVLLVPSVFSAIDIVQQNRLSRSMNTFVNENKHIGRSYIYDSQMNLDADPATLDLFIAGEPLTAEDSTTLYHSAATHGLSPSQLFFHQDAVYDNSHVTDLQVVLDIMKSHEQKIQELQAENDSLRTTIDSLRLQINSLPQNNYRTPLRNKK